MKIYIDVTKLLSVPYLTGIQRVVREVALQMISKQDMEVVLLHYNEYYHLYKQVNTQKFYDYYENGKGKVEELITDKVIDWKELQPGGVFYDIDSVWNLPLRRSVLLPKLKANGVKVATFVHDIIPITHPQFCHSITTFNFMNYIASYLQYGDLIISSTRSNLDAISMLLEQLNLPPIPEAVSWLGSDFKAQDRGEEEVHPDAVKAAESGTYVLMVGTIEPRKNHALVLDAFDSLLFDKGVNLIFAGGIGWNIDSFQKRMEQHPRKNQQFFHLSGMNDATIDYLYQHAYCVAFPTFNEGFGLPVIESFQRGTPVLASDIPVMREIGEGFCEYFDIQDWTDFANKLLNWMEHPEEYSINREKLSSYVPVTWDQVTEKMQEALLSLEPVSPYPIPTQVKQMVYLTARIEDLLESLPFVEHFMPFIQELVLCCPDAMAEEMKEQYHGRFQIKYLPDSELLAGTELPEDHTRRNFYLRCLAIEQEVLDDVFIMADDDYRPLCMIDPEVFIKDGVYQGYYCYHLEDWLGTQSEPTSFDQSMYRTRDFLQQQGYSTWMYDSHMPQIIDRRIFRELLEKYPEIKHQGLSDWSVYFNYLNTAYPGNVQSHPFVSLTWPDHHSAWDLQVFPQQYLFENYYRELYEEGEVFEGFSTAYYDGIERESIEKVTRYRKLQEEHNQARVMFQAYCANYELMYREWPVFHIQVADESCEITLPEYITISENEFTCIPFTLEYTESEERKGEFATISYRILDAVGNPLLLGETLNVNLNLEMFFLPIKGDYGGSKGLLEIQFKYRDIEMKKYTRISVIRKGISI